MAPKTVAEVLDICDSDVFPCISRLLEILATMPVSAAMAERSSSGLRRLNTWLRARMGQDRLVGFALLHMHRDIIVDSEKIINRFARRPRRL